MKTRLRSRAHSLQHQYWQAYGFTSKGRVKQKNYNRNRKTHLELASKCVLFSLYACITATEQTVLHTLLWKAERTEKALSCSQNNPSIQWKLNPTSFLKRNGPWMHKTLPLSWHLRTFKKFIQACFSRKHDINISLEVDSRITFHVCLYIINIHYNSILTVILLSVKHVTVKEGNAKKPLVKECTHKGKNAMTR